MLAQEEEEEAAAEEQFPENKDVSSSWRKK